MINMLNHHGTNPARLCYGAGSHIKIAQPLLCPKDGATEEVLSSLIIHHVSSVFGLVRWLRLRAVCFLGTHRITGNTACFPLYWKALHPNVHAEW